MDLTAGGRRYADLCRDMYLLSMDSAAKVSPRGPSRGWQWEARVGTTLAYRGFPVDAIPGGTQVLGALPESGLRHQTDAALCCTDAQVIGEWKSYTGSVPKDAVMRFKAVTDDLFDTLGRWPSKLPILRLFAVGGEVSVPLRWYAARHGITVVDGARWPAPVLADRNLAWPAGSAPSELDRRRLAWLSRPLADVYPLLADGSRRLPPAPPRSTIDSVLSLHDRWSARLWTLLDSEPGSFERFAADLVA